MIILFAKNSLISSNIKWSSTIVICWYLKKLNDIWLTLKLNRRLLLIINMAGLVEVIQW